MSWDQHFQDEHTAHLLLGKAIVALAIPNFKRQFRDRGLCQLGYGAARYCGCGADPVCSGRMVLTMPMNSKICAIRQIWQG